MKKTYALALLAPLAFGLVACGGSDYNGAEAPKNASTDAFCKVVLNLDTSDPKGFVKDLAETGTPKGIPADAREGFEVMVDNATEKTLSDAKQKKVSTFVSYFTSTCSGLGQ